VRFRATAALALLLVGLILYILYIELPQSQRREETEALARRVLHFSELNLTGLAIKHEHGETVLEKLADGTWRIAKPLATLADGVVVNALVSQLQDAEVTRVVEEQPADLTPYGLAAPVLEVTLRFGDREERLLLGEDAPFADALYAKTADDPRVLLIGLGIRSALSRPLKDFRNRTLFTFSALDVQEVSLQFPDRHFDMAKRGETWHLSSPLETKADQETVSSLLFALTGLRAEDFIDEQKDETLKGLGPPRLTVTVALARGGRAVTFYRAREKDVVYAVAQPEEPIYLLREQVFAPLAKDLYDLRDKQVLDFARSEVHAIEVKTESGAFTLTGGHEQWVLDGQDRADPGAVRRFLDHLEDLRTQAFVADGPDDLAPYGLRPPRAEVNLADREQLPIGVLHVGDQEGELVYAKSGVSDTVIQVMPEILEMLRRDTYGGKQDRS